MHTSASMNIRIWPSADAAARFRAQAGPRRSGIETTRAPCAIATSADSSQDASSATRHSKLRYVEQFTAARDFPSVPAALYAGMIIEISGGACIQSGNDPAFTRFKNLEPHRGAEAQHVVDESARVLGLT